MFDSIFGAGVFQSLFGPATYSQTDLNSNQGQSGHANLNQTAQSTSINPAQVYTAMMAKQQAQMNSYMRYKNPDWVFAGKTMTITEFADAVYGDTPAKTLFLLKHSEKEQK